MADSALRAKQFLPYDALKGFSEALRKKEEEIEIEEKIDLSEESKEEISEKLFLIDKNDFIKVKYYNYNFKRYMYIEGIVKEVSKLKKRIVFMDDNKVDFEDILDISKM